MGMHGRCKGHDKRKHKYYLERGITVCDRWKTFDVFLRDMGIRPEGTTLDRIDNNLGYFPENCRWANASTQMQNRKTVVWFTLNGETLCLSDWAKKIGINRQTLMNRINKWGWSVEKALTTLSPKQRKLLK
jgi:hypothetical protein